MYCKNYNECDYTYKTNKSFVEFECDYAVRNNLPIVVLYNSATVDKSKCFDSDVNIAKVHARMVKRGADGKYYWDYQSVKVAFDKLGD